MQLVGKRSLWEKYKRKIQKGEQYRRMIFSRPFGLNISGITEKTNIHNAISNKNDQQKLYPERFFKKKDFFSESLSVPAGYIRSYQKDLLPHE